MELLHILLRESQVKDLERIVSSFEASYSEMGLLARKAYEDYPSEAAYFNYVVSICLGILGEQRVPETVYWKLAPAIALASKMRDKMRVRGESEGCWPTWFLIRAEWQFPVSLICRRNICSLSERILVSGGAGFIGSHLVDALVARGHAVAVFDNLDPQVHGPLREQGRWPAYANPGAEYILGDVRDRDALAGRWMGSTSSTTWPRPPGSASRCTGSRIMSKSTSRARPTCWTP